MSCLKTTIAGALLVTVMSVSSVRAQEPAVDSFEDVTLAFPIIVEKTGTFNGTKLSYTAAVEKTSVLAEDGTVGADLVTFAYTVESEDVRPVMFVFNGGPIVAAQYLHMGVLGPKRVAFADDISENKYEVVENDLTILDVADLVFVDPASTGFSRVAAGKNYKDYYSVQADGQQVAAFIAGWLKNHDRLSAPVYIFGESYGTMRAPEVAKQLAELREPILADGVVLFGQAANIIEYAQRKANIISYVVSLPTLTATGWYHGKVKAGKGGIEALLEKSRKFAEEEYLQALYLGDRLPEKRKKAVAKKLEMLSGIPADYYLAHDLRISKEEYRLELLKGNGLLLGRSDSRYIAPVTEKGRAPDPSGVLSDTLQDEFRTYMTDMFGIKDTSAYRNFAPVKGLDDWDWGPNAGPFSDYPYQRSINILMDKNPEFRVLVANGYYDTQTTMGAAEYLITQSGWPKDRKVLKYYPGGHMAYSITETARAVTDDLRAFVTGQ